MATLKTRDFPNVELLAPGTWQGITGEATFTDEDLDGIIQAYEAQRGKLPIPIKIGHNSRQKLADGQPAMGWVENVRKDGAKIVGDLLKVPAKLADLIQVGSYRSRSVELAENVKFGDTTFPLALTAVSLLGEALPAVESLDDIIQLFTREGISPEKETVIYLREAGANDYTEEVPTFEDLIAGIDEWYSTAETFFRTKPGAPALRSLHKVFKDNLTRIHKGERKMALTSATLTLLGLTETSTEAEIEAAIAAKLATPPSNDDSEIKTELSAATKRIITLEQQLAANDANNAVDAAITAGKLLPKQRDMAIKLALRDMAEFNSFIETQPNMIELGERGSSIDGSNLTKFEPTEAEVSVAKMMGVWSPEHRITLMRQKAASMGVTLPADLK